MSGQAILQEIANSIDHSTLPSPAAGLRDFIESIPEEKWASDRRRSDRYRADSDVVIIPLNEDLRLADEAPDTPLAIAAERNHAEIVTMLTNSPERRARDGRTAANRRNARDKRRVGG